MSPEMEAGRELDAQIAEKVMGWRRESESWYDEEGVEGTAWYNDEADSEYPAATAYGWGDEIEYGGEGCRFPPYSTDIAAAWEVVEKLAAQGFAVRVQSGWRCEVSRPDETGAVYGSAEAPTAPHAICLAALKAVEREASAG